MFVVRGSLYGHKAVVVWDDGELRCNNKAILDIVNAEAGLSEGEGPCGGPTWYGEEILKHATPTFLLLKKVLDDVELVEGTLPPLPQVPKGATP
jgi:hypothetical protein